MGIIPKDLLFREISLTIAINISPDSWLLKMVMSLCHLEMNSTRWNSPGRRTPSGTAGKESWSLSSLGCLLPSPEITMIISDPRTLPAQSRQRGLHLCSTYCAALLITPIGRSSHLIVSFLRIEAQPGI